MTATSVSRSVVALRSNRILSNIKCLKCNKVVRNGILCDLWHHFRCAGVKEDDLLNENDSWKYPRCCDSSLDVSLSANDQSTLTEIINTLKDDNSRLKETVTTLKSLLEQSDFEHSKSLQTTQVTVENEGWKTVPLKSNFNVKKSVFQDKDFPPLLNRFNPLTRIENEDAANTGETSTHGHRKNRNTCRKRSINLYMDSQGRNVALKLRAKSDFTVKSDIKPGANFEDVTKDCEKECKRLGKQDVVVLLAGTNDIGRNEGKEMLNTLRKRLQNLHFTNVLVCNVPFRYDLPEWSCVNKEIARVNQEIFKLSKYVKNCTTLDIGRLGKRFHTQHGLHLNDMAKSYIADKVLEVMDSLFLSPNNETPCPIALPVKN